MNVDILKQRARAFDYMFDAIVVTDLQGFIIDWNKGSEILYGYSKEQAIGQPVNMLHVPGDTEQITSEVLSAVEKQGNGLVKLECYIRMVILAGLNRCVYLYLVKMTRSWVL